MSGTFVVANSKYDSTLKTTTLLEVRFETGFGKFAIAGTSTLGLSIAADRQGVLTKSWKVLDPKIEIEDSRSVSDVLKDYLEFEKVSFHNGSFSLGPAKAGLVAEDLVVDLERMLEDGEEANSCRFLNETSADTVLWQLKEHAPDLASYLAAKMKTGDVVLAVSRTFDAGESESCSYYYFEIVTKDGLRISLQFDFTT